MIARLAAGPTVGKVSYDEHLRRSHLASALRPVPPGERPPLPVEPRQRRIAGTARPGSGPGTVVRFEARYHGVVPVTRRLDGAGRVLYAGVADVLGWVPGTALTVSIGPGHWVTFRSAGRPASPSERRLAHVDRQGRLVVFLGVRAYLSTDVGEEVLLVADATAGALRIADVSLLALALDVLERAEAALFSSADGGGGDGPTSVCTPSPAPGRALRHARPPRPRSSAQAQGAAI